jgi:hypothetical protein
MNIIWQVTLPSIHLIHLHNDFILIKFSFHTKKFFFERPWQF